MPRMGMAGERFALYLSTMGGAEGAMARGKDKRTVLGTLIDHDKAATYRTVKMLFFVRWLERHPLIKRAAILYADRFF